MGIWTLYSQLDAFQTYKPINSLEEVATITEETTRLICFLRAHADPTSACTTQRSTFFFFHKRFKRFVSADDLRRNKSDPAECVCIQGKRSKRAFEQNCEAVPRYEMHGGSKMCWGTKRGTFAIPAPSSRPLPPKTVGVWNNGLFARLVPHLCTLADRHTNAIGQLRLSMLTSFLETRLQLFCQCRAGMQ